MINYVYTFITGRIPTQVQKIIDKNKAFCKNKNVPFKIFNYEVESRECAAGKSDWLRLEHATTEPDILYVDWDCEIQSMDFDQTKLLFSSYYAGTRRIPDIWAFFNSDKFDFFKETLDAIKTKKGKFASYQDWMIDNGPVDGRIGRFELFDDNCFYHHAFNTGRIYKS